jgi:DNA helicase-2/ATP-dependent DNA helicase PcrA
MLPILPSAAAHRRRALSDPALPGSAPPGAEALLAGLNPEQRCAVETVEGPLLVLAGAGSGKTRVLVHRIAYLIGACGIPAESILAVTFTNKAAGEMRERVEKLLGPDAAGIWVSTFHSTCVRILRREAGQLGLSRGFAIYDEDDALATVKEALRRRGRDPKTADPRGLRWRIDQWKNAGVLPAQAAGEAADLEAEEAAETYAVYQRLLREANALDFGDLILQVVELFDRFPQVLEHYQRRWQYVLVDEYQDTNRVQYRLVRQLAQAHANLCVVGDPQQSIYGWRGADIRNILDFERDFPEARVVALERNYRSRRPILEGASAVVANNASTRSLRLRAELGEGEPIRFFEALDERSEAAFVVREILTAARRDGRSFGDFAVFYRTNAQSRPFEDELLRYDVPYVVVGGLRFYERAEVKDALAYLRLALNPADSAALRRVVNAPARGIGRTTLERAEQLAEREGVPALEGLRRLAAAGGAGRAAGPIRDFLALVDELGAQVRGVAPAEAIARVLQKSGYLAALEREGTPEAEARLENLRELVAGAEDFVAESVEGDEERAPVELFLDQVALVSDVDRWDRRAERVSLMTAHSAKGLEFPVVFLVGLEEGVFPHAAAARDPAGIEEERRLFYVGMTRAMERLYLSCAQERRKYGSRTFAVPSRFLREIPEEVLQGELPEAREAGPRGARRDDASLDYSYGQGEPETPGAAIPRGMRVRHPVFGAGTVLDVSGAGPNQKLRVRFDRVGVKTLVLRFANLEPA